MPTHSRKRQHEVALEDEDSSGPPKKVKSTAAADTSTLSAAGDLTATRDADGNEYWELSGMKRVVVSEFKGKLLVGIREFYEKDGKALPGKKGISLPVAQLGKFVTLLPQIEAAVKARGENLPRPVYDQGHAAAEASVGAEGASSEVKDVKRNFEETSEDDG